MNQQQLKEMLHYDPKTGLFTWAINRRSVKKGDIAGAPHKSAGAKRLTRLIVLNCKQYRADRLAFLYMTGEMPPYAGHKDYDFMNNAWDNLMPLDAPMPPQRRKKKEGRADREKRAEELSIRRTNQLNNVWRVTSC